MFKNPKTKHKSALMEFFGRFSRNRLTLMGRHLITLGIILLILAGFVISSTFLLYAIVLFFLFSFILGPILGWLLNPKLDVTVSTPTRAAAGSTMLEEIIVKNPTGKKSYLTVIREDDLPENIRPVEKRGLLIPCLSGGEQAHIRLRLDLQKRGSYKLKNLRAETSFPLGLTKTGVDAGGERHFLVYPSFNPIHDLKIPVGRKLQPGGIALASNVGESTEFAGTREFRDGDDPRFIHWRSWARLNKPVIKEFMEEYYVRIALFLDSFVEEDAPEKDYDAFESLLSLGASIADYLERQEYIIDIIAAGPEIYYLQAGRSLAHLDQILDIMACLDVCRNQPYDKLEPHLMTELAQISTVIVLFLGVDKRRNEFLLKLKDMGVDVKVFVVSDDPSIDTSVIENAFGPARIVSPAEIKAGLEQI